MKVMIVVTHLLGTGHLSRALTLAKGFVQAGHEAVVVSGGVPVPQLDPGDAALLQLPALRSDGVNFAQLLTAAGNRWTARCCTGGLTRFCPCLTIKRLMF